MSTGFIHELQMLSSCFTIMRSINESVVLGLVWSKSAVEHLKIMFVHVAHTKDMSQ